MRRAATGVFLTFLLACQSTWAQPHPARAAGHARAQAAVLMPAAINGAQWSASEGGHHRVSPVLLRTQILLDRAYFSPGEIDGAGGDNTTRALAGFQAQHHLQATGRLDAATWAALVKSDARPAVGPYTIAAGDEKGPFIRQIPHGLDKQAALPCLCYTSPLEELGEKFHASPRLLQMLNPGKDFSRAGEQIIVPIVHDGPPAKAVARVTVSKSGHVVRAFDDTGKLVAQYPATMGSVHDPLPIGHWKITGVDKHPVFHYNPDLFWDAKPDDTKATLPKGPNNPVGVVWMNLSKPHYGIHGTPEPSKIGKTQSHGCIRLTNWDAWNLSQMVRPGTPAILQN